MLPRDLMSGKSYDGSSIGGEAGYCRTLGAVAAGGSRQWQASC